MKKILSFIALIIVGVSVAGCSSQNNADSNTISSAAVRTKHKQSRKKVSQTKLKIKIGKKTLKAHLNNSAAAKAFAKELPKNMRFWTYGSMPEKVADLGHKLPTTGMSSGSRGRKGYIGYWSPDRRIVFYYGNESYWEGIHLIGKFDSKNYAKVIKSAPENVKVRIQVAK